MGWGHQRCVKAGRHWGLFFVQVLKTQTFGCLKSCFLGQGESRNFVLPFLFMLSFLAKRWKWSKDVKGCLLPARQLRWRQLCACGRPWIRSWRRCRRPGSSENLGNVWDSEFSCLWGSISLGGTAARHLVMTIQLDRKSKWSLLVLSGGFWCVDRCERHVLSGFFGHVHIGLYRSYTLILSYYEIIFDL